jgi:demethylmenaquinone methyltransferase / 2-methoxy-6-polyprenyl-1,4-benzoquinol methylase
MQEDSQKDKTARVQAMFTRIAGHYDLMNRVMSAGQDRRWRRQLIDFCSLPAGGWLLDLGAGTGDLAREALRRQEKLRVVGGDYTLEMMRQGRGLAGGERIRWTNINALQLPFPDGTFDVVTSGYLMRNVSDVDRAWREQFRVLKPGGMALCLDTTPPPHDALHIPVNFYLKKIVPLLGWLLTGNKVAYTYLPESTEQFLTAEDLSIRMGEAGFKAIRFRRTAFGSMAFHWGFKTH